MKYPNVKAEAARRGMSSKQLAEKSGIKYCTLIRKLSGESPLMVSEAVKICEALGGMSMDYLFNDREVR